MICTPKLRSQVRIPLEAEFSSGLYCTSLHKAFHYHPSLSQYDLNNVERDVKHQIIVIIIMYYLWFQVKELSGRG